MFRKTEIPVAVIGLVLFAGLGLAVHQGAIEHMRGASGGRDVSKASCFDCHWVSTSRLAWAKPRPRHAAPAGLAVSAEGKRLYIALDDRNEVAEVDTATRRVERTAHVAGGPTGLALDPSGERLYVACRSGNRVAALDTRAFAEVGTVAVGLSPVAVAYFRTHAGDRLVVANSGSDEVSIVSVAPLRELVRLSAGREPFAVAASPDGSRAVVVNRLADLTQEDVVPVSEVTIVDPGRERVLARQPLNSSHLAEGIAPVPGRSWVLTPLVKARNLVPITQVARGWVMSSGLAICDLAQGNVVQVPLDDANHYFADPSGIVVDPAGHRAYIASGGSDAVTVVDLDRLARWLEEADAAARQEAIDNLELPAQYVQARISTGRNPRHLALSPDGGVLYVAERLDDAVLEIDTHHLRPLGRIVLDTGFMNDPIRRGERVFTSAFRTFQNQFSCRSCHPGGHVDGLAYDFDIDGIGRNIVDNRSLQGLAGTAPFKWNGKNPSLQVQCGVRFAKVLMRTLPFSKAQLDDLADYLQSLPPARTRSDRSGPLTEAQQRGRQIFFATRTPDGLPIPHGRQCATCHRPPLYTDRIPADVGTRGPHDDSGVLDTPHLLGIAASAPYLHDGRSATLEEIWTVYNPEDLHGVTSHLNKIQLNDLIEFLKTL